MFDSVVVCPRVNRRRRRGSDAEGDKNDKNITWVPKNVQYLQTGSGETQSFRHD